MFRFSLQQKIISIIILMLSLMIFIGFIAYLGFTDMLGATQWFTQISKLDQTMTSAELQADKYHLSIYSNDEKLQEMATQETLHQLAEADRIIGNIRKQATNQNLDLNTFEVATAALNNFGALFDQYREIDTQKATIEANSDEVFLSMMALMEQGVLRREEMILVGNIYRASVLEYFRTPNDDKWSIVESDISKLEQAIKTWSEFIANSERLSKIGNDIQSQFQNLKTVLNQYRDLSISQLDIREGMKSNAQKLNQICTDLVAKSTSTMREQTDSSLLLILGAIVLAVITGFTYAAVSVKGIVGKLKDVISGVMNGSKEVSTASNEIASASNSLAKGVSRQAASLEESASSLEEISLLTKQNASRAHEAKSIMDEAQQIVKKVNDHMDEMTMAVAQITQATQETDKIISTIDAIAFQTNLLALNAAVEAARAGKSGAGFAVVADEVRSLASRAAEAAKNTSNLIQNTIQNVARGNELAILTKNASQENVSFTKKVRHLIDEISVASNEQAQGIEQVNLAVSEMSDIVQQNAADSQESAGAAQLMNAQAEQMAELVQELVFLVGKSRKDEEVGTNSTLDRPQKNDHGLPLPADDKNAMVKVISNRLLSQS